jgi:hypothetical protein
MATNRQLIELAAWHDEWTAKQVATGVDGPYDQFVSDMQASSTAQDEFHTRARQIMGLPPLTEMMDRPVQAKFNPEELRLPDGTWTDSPGGAVKDLLHLADRIDLAPGESLVSSKKVYLGHNGVAKVAVTELNGTRSVRLGLGGGGDFSQSRWRAAPKGLTVKLNPDQVRELTAGIDAAEKKAKAGEAAANKLWDATEAAQGTAGHAALLKKAQDAVDGFVVPSGVVSGEWGDVHYGYAVTDTGYTVAVAVRPDGAPADWSLEDAASNDAGVELYDAAGVAQLRKLLNSLAGSTGRVQAGADGFDQMTRERLRRIAKTRGIALIRGEQRDSIIAKLRR